VRIPPVFAACAAALTAACAPLTLFANLTPKDPAIAAESGAAYGGDPRQRLDVYAPKTVSRAAPIAIFFYGGGWDSGRRQDYGWVGRALAAQGFVTIVADYRVYPQVVYPAFLEDGALTVRWAVDHAQALGGDPERIVLVGHSAGAYNAVMLGLDGRYLKAAGVEPRRIRAVAGLAGPYDFLPLEGDISTRTFGGAADPKDTQPITYARAGAPAAFLATGDNDKTVLPRNTHALAAALRAKGVTVEEKTYAHVDHPKIVLALSKPLRGTAPVLADLSRFLHAQTP
jgi:acetyl esterase/lipase